MNVTIRKHQKYGYQYVQTRAYDESVQAKDWNDVTEQIRFIMLQIFSFTFLKDWSLSKPVRKFILRDSNRARSYSRLPHVYVRTPVLLHRLLVPVRLSRPNDGLMVLLI